MRTGISGGGTIGPNRPFVFAVTSGIVSTSAKFKRASAAIGFVRSCVDVVSDESAKQVGVKNETKDIDAKCEVEGRRKKERKKIKFKDRN